MNVSGFYDWFSEPLRYQFMVTAIWVSALVGLVCAVLSCFMILRGWSLMGDSVSHAVLPGVVISYIVGIPFAVGAFTFGLLCVLVVGFVKARTRLKEDTVLGSVFTGFFALGLVLISRTPSNIDLNHILFGNVLGISPSDIHQTAVIGVVTLAIILLLRKDLLLFCFDPIFARTIGLRVGFLHYLLLILLALTTVAALQTVGTVLVIAMLVAPGAIAYLLTDRFDRMLLISSAVGVSSSVLGAYWSYHIDVSTGGCIVVLQFTAFMLAVFLAPKHGLLGQRIRRRAAGRREQTAEASEPLGLRGSTAD